MKIFDYWWYLYYRFSHYTCKRDAGDAKWIAILAFSTNFFLIVDTFIRVFSFFFCYSLFVKYWDSKLFLLALLIPIISAPYFYKFRKREIEKIDKEYNGFTYRKRKKIMLIFAIMTIVPMLLYIFYIPCLRPT